MDGISYTDASKGVCAACGEPVSQSDSVTVSIGGKDILLLHFTCYARGVEGAAKQALRESEPESKGVE